MPSLLQQGQVAWIANFKGLNDSLGAGTSPNISPDLRNVKCRYGKVFGRGGMAKYLAIDTAASNSPIIQLFPFARDSQSANQLLRMTQTKLEKLNTSTVAWDDVTGTALANAATTRPQYTIIDDTLTFTPEGLQVPRKYTGSGNSANIGGSPPYCKVMGSYEGFLFLGDISTSGTFTDITDGYRSIRYSDDWDTTWSDCDAAIAGTIVLHETPGSVVRLLQLERELMAYKTDGLVALNKVTGGTVFSHRVVPAGVGTNSPLAVSAVPGKKFHLMLGTDGIIYKVSANDVVPVTEEVLANTLHTAAIRDLDRYQYARSMIDSEEGLYILCYDRTGLSGQLLDSYVAYNYISGETVSGRLGLNITSAAAYKPSKTEREVALLASATLVEEFDAAATNDDGTAIDRYWTTGWQKLSGGQEGWFTGALIHMKRDKRARIRVSVAVDMDPTFRFAQVMSLAGSDPSSTLAEVEYTPPPQYGEWFNLKIEFIHPTSSSDTEVQRVGFVGSAVHQVPTQDAQAAPSRGW